MIIEELLLNSGVDFIRLGDELLVTCPFCPDRVGSEDKKRRLGINTRKFKANCFRCEWHADGMREIVKKLSEAFGVPYDIMALIRASREADERVQEEPDQKPPVETGLPEGYEPFRGSGDFVEKQARAYLKSRGVTAEQIKRHRLGYAAVGPYAWRIIFPVFARDKRVYGFVARDFTGTAEPKYLNSKGTKLLYGAQFASEAAVMQEGVLDALRVEQALTGATALADLGSAMTTYQLNQLKRYKTRVYLPDWDAAGIKAAMHIGDKCLAAGLALYVAVPRVLDGRDPGSMSIEDIQEWASTAKLYSKSLTYRMRTIREA